MAAKKYRINLWAVVQVGISLSLVTAGVAWLQAEHAIDKVVVSQTIPSNNPWALPADTPAYVREQLNSMSLHDKVASLFMLHTPGTSPAYLASYVDTYKIGGLIFMEDNLPRKFSRLRAQTSALTAGKQLPPLIAIDQEGGQVVRLRPDRYPGAGELRNHIPVSTLVTFAKRSALLQRAGINLNFGIVADVTADPQSFIYGRVLGLTPEAASKRVDRAVAGSRGKTLSTLKHFPGHGETPADSHSTIPVATTSYRRWQRDVAQPFRAGIDAGADLVMFGHLRYAAVDTRPATLSKKWHQILVDELGFKGVSVTDDMTMLQMSGQPVYANPVKNAVDALAAGNDLLLYVLDHNSQLSQINPNALINGVVRAVKKGQLSEQEITQHAQKVLGLRYGLAGL